MERIPMTRQGYQKLQEELRTLKGQERPAIIKAIAFARELGDLSENAEYHAARERQGMIEGRIATLGEKIAFADIIDPSSMNGDDRVVFGATVTVENCETEERTAYQIVGEIESDVARGRLSVQSPLAKATIGRTRGDVVLVLTPQGSKEYEIVDVSYQ